MGLRGRRACAAKRGPKGKNSEKNESDKINSNLSLPVISEEKFYNDDSANVGNIAEDNYPKLVIPKIRIKCKPLNIEKIIDYANNKVYVKRKREDRNSQSPKVRQTRSKSAIKNDLPPVTSLTPTATPKPRKYTKRKAANSENAEEKAKPYEKVRRKKMRMSNKDYPNEIIKVYPSTKKKLVSNDNIQEQDSQSDTTQNLQNLLSSALPSEIPDKPVSSTPSSLDGNSSFFELTNLKFDELAPQLDRSLITEFNIKSQKGIVERKNNVTDNITNNLQNSVDPRNRNDSCEEKLNKNFLQTACENFMNNPQLQNLKDKAGLKKGLCISRLTNKACLNEKCHASHNAFNLFTQKLKRFPSKFIITEVVSMRNDIFFADIVMAALKVISERKIPLVWVTFLTYFVFYVSEPSDSRFLKFWTSAARFFCELKENYSTARGFASLLSIFSHVGNTEEWKIIEFIKLIKQPPVQVHVSYALLQPVLKLDLPCEFLMEAVELSTKTQKDMLKVYSFVIPKISIPKAQIQVVEGLIKFCKTLELLNHKNLADDLKQRLRGKVLSFKTLVSHQDYPLTAAFQEELFVDKNEENYSTDYDNRPNDELILDFEARDSENHYFQPEGDFCNLFTEAMELSSNTFLNPYSQTEDICDRQLTRIKQFFRDARFDLLGKYINELKSEVVDRVAEEILKSLFQMKISIQQGVDLIKIIILPCKTENATKVIASVCITLILNLVRVHEWKKAYTILSLCQRKNINLIEGKVFHFNEFRTLTQCRIVLLLIEIQCYVKNYTSAVELVKKYCLFSSNNYSWQVTGTEEDESIRVRILEDLLCQVITEQLSEEAYELFKMIWKEQTQLARPIDLKKFINEILVLLLNQENEEAIQLYEQIKNDIQLHEITVRALLVSLVRRNLLSAAKYLVLSPQQNAYSLPDLKSDSTVMKVYSFWLEEEIFVIFDVFLNSLIANTSNFNAIDYDNFEIQLQESKTKMNLSLRPLCLGIINPSFKEACSRIQRVLHSQFQPPLKLIIMPYTLRLEEHSLRLHIEKRLSIKSL